MDDIWKGVDLEISELDNDATFYLTGGIQFADMFVKALGSIMGKATGQESIPLADEGVIAIRSIQVLSDLMANAYMAGESVDKTVQKLIDHGKEILERSEVLREQNKDPRRLAFNAGVVFAWEAAFELTIESNQHKMSSEQKESSKEAMERTQFLLFKSLEAFTAEKFESHIAEAKDKERNP